jgi:membrane protein
MKRTAVAMRLIDIAAWTTLGAAAVAFQKSVMAPAEDVIPVRRSLHSFGWLDWRAVAQRTAIETQKDRLTTVAGGVTFSVLLSIFPTLAAFVSLYGLFADVNDVSRHLTRLRHVMPPGVVGLIGDQMVRLATTRSSDLSLALGLSLLLALWSANSGMGAMFNGLNSAYGVPESRVWWKRILVTLACTATSLILLIVLAGVTAALPAWLRANGWQIASVVGQGLSWVVLFAAVISALAGLYRFGPSHTKPAWRTYWPGAIAATVIWLGGSLLFSTYVGQFGHYERTYGSLGAIIGFMVWIWFSALAVLVGAEFNAEIEKRAMVGSAKAAPQLSSSVASRSA